VLQKGKEEAKAANGDKPKEKKQTHTSPPTARLGKTQGDFGWQEPVLTKKT